MPINVTGPGKFRHSAHANQFGVIFRVSTRIPNSTDYWIQTHTLSDYFSNDPTQVVVIFDDEDVLLHGVYRTSSTRGTSSRRGLLHWPSTVGVRAVVEVTTGDGGWSEVTAMTKTPSDRGIALATRFRLQPGARAFRVRVTEGFWRAVIGSLLFEQSFVRSGPSYESPPLQVHVKRAPAILTFIAMGGSGSAGSTGIGSGSDSNSSSSSSSSSSSGNGSSGSETLSDDELRNEHGIWRNASRCAVDSTLIADLVTAQNVQCNDLCANCVTFIEHLGSRIFDEENLANHLQSLRHKEAQSEPDFCADRTNPDGISHRIVLGKWENSEHEHFRPPAIKTFESILDEYDAAGGGALIIVANSLAGAKLAATVKDHWRWGERINVFLFVAWDATHLGGGITSLGQRPQRVLNFFQRENTFYFQTGDSIAEADVEFNLTGCLSHNAIARSALVHEETYKEVRSALAEIRAVARDQ